MPSPNINTNTISAANLDYLQRTNIGLAELPLSLRSNDLLCRVFHIKGVSINKHTQFKENAKEIQLPGEILLSSLYGTRTPIAFLVDNQQSQVKIHVGTWSTVANNNNSSIPNIERRQAILSSALNSLYMAMDMKVAEVNSADFPLSGLVLGIPTPIYPRSTEDPMAIDRIIQAISDGRWSFLILAEPVAESSISQIRQSIIEEMRLVHLTAQSGQAPPALLEHYNDLLKISLESSTIAVTIGGWRTAVYLLGDEDSYPRLSSLWRGVFAGDKSLPESIRVWNLPGAGKLAREWSMPETPGSEAPGKYRRPLEFQTILTSKQLAAYIHLPQLETVGFKVTTIPMFDVMPHESLQRESVAIGDIILRTRRIDQSYTISINELTRHAFVSGVTGAGKTNTIFSLLGQLASVHNVPFLVIEPAKTEYRSLLNDPYLKDKLQIFTLGNEQVAPLRLNPFEVLPGTSVGVHLDLLRSVFAASFGMWTPLPQILEKSLYEIYKDRGWDIAANRNSRLREGTPDESAFPTLSDLAVKVEEVTKQLGYEDRLTADLQAALLTRINSLRTGPKGMMLDVQQSVPMEALLDKPTIIELEGIGDDDDKAFLMGLILIKLVAYRRSRPQYAGLKHVLVFEEAHRLLTNVSAQTRAEEANPRGKAVETFAHLLSEIRAFGQGVIISDQVPVKLAPDVIKNTNLKIMHRLVAADDRTILAGATAMNEKQSAGLSILEKGQAAVFSEGDDAPVLVKVPYVKSQMASPSDLEVAEYMRQQIRMRPFLLPQNAPCSTQCQVNPGLCQLAREIVAGKSFQQTFARIALSTIHDTGALERLWPDLKGYIAPRLSSSHEQQPLLECVLHHAAWWFAYKRGAHAVWPYVETAQFAVALKDALLSRLNANGQEKAVAHFREAALQQHRRTFDPFPACGRICGQNPPLCLYRSAVVDLIGRGKFTALWTEGKPAYLANAPTQEVKDKLWELCQDAGHELMEFADDSWPEEQAKIDNHAAARRASLCFGLNMLSQNASLSPTAALKSIGQLISYSKHNG